jgi:hypothetical protein
MTHMTHFLYESLEGIMRCTEPVWRLEGKCVMCVMRHSQPRLSRAKRLGANGGVQHGPDRAPALRFQGSAPGPRARRAAEGFGAAESYSAFAGCWATAQPGR